MNELRKMANEMPDYLTEAEQDQIAKEPWEVDLYSKVKQKADSIYAVTIKEKRVSFQEITNKATR